MNARSSFRDWLLADTAEAPGQHTGPHGKPAGEKRAHWFRVMCLTGVDYFSTLGYQPAIAALAAGAIAPLATIVLVLVTLAGALPVYRRVAAESPHGTGSIAILAKLLPKWGGKLVVLALLGFAATDFMITMTLSAADATAHLVENPFAPSGLKGQEVIITLALLAGLGTVFLRGFREAIRVATGLVGVFLALNLVVVVVAMLQLLSHPVTLGDWWSVLTTQHGNPLFVVAIALLVFPKLALGLSGFETGVAVMPQIRGDASDTEAMPTGRIRGAKRLLTTSALIMSGFLITSSITTVALIPAQEFEQGGAANGRALAYLAHQYLGNGFGTVYDVATIAILWFAGASAMAGLLNLVPRYLPHYGMAPAWARATRPLVLVFCAIAFLITILFQASVDAQGGAYATGVLVLITSAAIAVTLLARSRRERGAVIGFGIVSFVFVFTTIANIIERPDGIKIAACFIVGILLVSFVSRIARSTELRATSVSIDSQAEAFLRESMNQPLQLIAHEPNILSAQRYEEKLGHASVAHHLPIESALFIEVEVDNSSEFEGELLVRGVTRHGYRVLSVQASSVPNAIAAVTLHLAEHYGCMPHVYFRWTEGKPLINLLRFLLFGEGEIAPTTREVLRAAQADPTRRPWIHVA
ncbi:amino acid transporter [Leucobacter sp. UT-8R-CII-1-4]|uniref:amino acid transporter n=1 Tax=Leucobacter sp. UT-8R-CII-1-4 TaxID=3040075 RepID=UPI0024A90D5B|nr:amino acid transporter [Leucobacter sp. UT-8R-CII-1-4]MDI6023477.1 amino acid transporter [Leucobacter sp. UT-8R-CII-1-4]